MWHSMYGLSHEIQDEFDKKKIGTKLDPIKTKTLKKGNWDQVGPN